MLKFLFGYKRSKRNEIAMLVPLWILALSVVPVSFLSAQTPPGLLNLGATENLTSKSRDWEKLGVTNYELRVLERFYRDDTGIEGYHIAYDSLGLIIAGILVQPHIELPDESTSMNVNIQSNTETEEQIKYPMVVLSHGSVHGLTQSYREVAIEFARRGYIVLAPSYRGRGDKEGLSQGHSQFARGEVLDLLQLVQIGRQIEYVDSQRMALLGFDDGATTALLAIERSNVFKVAILASPNVFSGMAEYGYTGIKILKKRSKEIFGRQLSRPELMRELHYRDGFRNSADISTPLLVFITGNEVDPNGLRYFLRVLQQQDRHSQVLDYPTMFRGFLMALDTGEHPPTWEINRDTAWGQIFDSIGEYLPEPEGAAITSSDGTELSP